MLDADLEESLWGYLEADAPLRAPLFGAFIQALADLRTVKGAGAAADAARLAVSPALDYTSMVRLGRFVPRVEPSAADALRLAVLGGPTTLQLARLLETVLGAAGIPAIIYECEYGLFRQDVLTPGSGLDAFAPEIVFLAVDARDVSQSPALTSSDDELQALLRTETQGWEDIWEAARRQWGATVIQNTFVAADYPALGHLACRVPQSREAYLDLVNHELLRRAPDGVVFHDLRLLAHDVGLRHWFDPRFYLEAKMPCAPESLVAYAFSVGALIRGLRGKSRKVLVLDLDNTLWGGVVGDVGVEGLSLGQGSGEGEAYLAFQHHVRALHDRGVLLAVCSKNDDARAREVFETRRDMVIRLEHIACFVANWQDKAQNLRHIARTLSLGLDSLVFVDDNPTERALVRRLVPEVAVPDLPEDPAGYGHALAAHQFFESPAFTAEDAARPRYYKQRMDQADLASRTGDIDAFLRSLDMVATVEPVGPVNIQRVTQLLNKSNQFNLTTRRYTLARIEAIAADPGWETRTISLRDRFGDNGLVSVLLLEQQGDELVVDTWLMSCRVLQRGVERFALGVVVRAARARGCTAIRGTYVPSGKNGMVREHYAGLGFDRISGDEPATAWRLDLSTTQPELAVHIREEA